MPHDELVLEIADDQVESGLPDGESMLHSWREVEVELGPAGKQKDLKKARKLLVAAGATPSTVRTKLDRALGPIAPDGEESTMQAGKVTSGTLGELVAAYLATQCDVLASNDVGLRTGAPVVHKTRVAARRLRSTLRVFGRRIRRAAGSRAEQRTGRGTPSCWARCATGRFSTLGSTSTLPICRRSRFADLSRPRSPRLSLPSETTPCSD